MSALWFWILIVAFAFNALIEVWAYRARNRYLVLAKKQNDEFIETLQANTELVERLAAMRAESGLQR